MKISLNTKLFYYYYSYVKRGSDFVGWVITRGYEYEKINKFLSLVSTKISIRYIVIKLDLLAPQEL